MFKRSLRLIPLLIAAAIAMAGCESVPSTTTQPPSPAPAQTPVEPPPAPAPTPTQAPAPAPVEIITPAPDAVDVPEPKPPAPIACVAPKPHKPAPPERPKTVLPILGGVERVSIVPPGLELEARLNTGAASSILDARNIRAFERDGAQWVKFQVIDRKTRIPTEISRPLVHVTTARGDADSKRYVVKLKTRLGSIDQFVEYTLDDRSSSRYPVLLGRNFLRDQALVDVARRFTVNNNTARP
jgi:hypothetical protein